MPRLRLRTRLTVAFAAVMMVLLAAIAVAAHVAMAAALLDELDAGLRFRAVALGAASPSRLPDASLEEPGEAFDQRLTSTGVVLQSNGGGPRGPVLQAADLTGVHGPTFFVRRLPGVADRARLLVLPSGQDYLVVGTTMADRTDALRQLTLVLGLAGPVAVALSCLAGWCVAGLALRPMERMRQQAAAITASGLDRRLDVPPAQDELRLLATTLNDLLARLEDAATRDRAFLERASHELRTPLTALKAELDLATHGPRTADALWPALVSANEEADRLARLANDLLVLARTRDGRLPIRREAVSLRELLERAASAVQARGVDRGIDVQVVCRDAMVHVDGMRVRQVLDNLADNALRHGLGVTRVTFEGDVDDDTVRLCVRDDGAGFVSNGDLSEGLGLRIAATVARSHGGELLLSSSADGGAVVVLRLPG